MLLQTSCNKIRKMLLQNKQGHPSMSLGYSKLHCENNQNQGLKFDICECAICKMKSLELGDLYQPIEKQDNGLLNFIKEFPPIFPLIITPTTAFDSEKGHHLHYSNGSRQQHKGSIFKTKTNKLVSNFPLTSNIHIFGNNFSKIISKSQVSSFTKNFEDKNEAQHKKSTSQKKMTSSLLLPSLSDSSPSELNPQSYRFNQSFNHSKYKNSKILYVQAYSQEIPIKVYYDNKTINSKFDNILREYMNDEVENFSVEKTYNINQQFWGWIYLEYGQNIFAHFITEFYCRAYNYFSKNTINKGIFYWIFEKTKSQFGDNTKVTQQLGKHKKMLQAQYLIQKSKKLNFKTKLTNIKNVDIEYYKNILTFQQEYQDIILNKIKTSSNDPKKQSLNQKKNYIYKSRLDNLHSKVRDLFLKQQNKVLNKVEVEKQYEGKQDSNKLARLLLPGMKEQQTIREILNDQFAFQKLILFQQKKVERERLKRAKERLLTQTQDKSNSKHIYEQSRSKKRNFTSRRIRMKTQY